MATVLVTGGTGLIGTALVRELTAKGHDIIIMSRSVRTPSKNISYAQWDPARGQIDAEAVKKADYVVHLAGANVADGRWTEKRKAEIVDSRVKSGELLVKAISETPNRIQAIVSFAATGWYGPDPQIPNPKPFTENDPAASDFLATTCRKWEEAIHPVAASGKRLVILRAGIVLSDEGGAYREFRKTLSLGIASVLGSGRQVVSWIHIDDMVRITIEAIENTSFSGVYNAVAPNPVSNKKIITTIATQRKKPYMTVNVPEIALKALLGEMSIEVLKSATVSSARLQSAGFRFFFEDIGTAVHNLEGRLKGN
ncbi:MAG TPA: TIGR01777 family oxidoreductase [Flavisolibacter sp.]|jgi:hypothetical protein